MTRARELIAALERAWGPQRWWPAETPFEVCCGAILTQNTSWKNVEKAIANLRAAGALNCDAVLACGTARLEELLRPAGTFRVKAKRLMRFCKWLHEEHGGDLDRLFARGPDALRDTLLEVPGIGPETADSIALYAGGKATFVADAYTHRILARHGLVDWESGYDDVRGFFMEHLEPDPALFNEAHALLVKAGKEHCKSKPACDGCPLQPLLPEGGLRERPQW
ncbi:MAG: endonuclease III domain-containing protein [Planctomycetes bacterium]|nr:endonuclease III domain-containing protein [Planctomycetota bacterium]